MTIAFFKLISQRQVAGHALSKFNQWQFTTTKDVHEYHEAMFLKFE